MAGMSRTEQITAIAAAIGMYFLLDHLRLLNGHLERDAALGFGFMVVVILWPSIVKKKNGSDDPS
jgi:hypothetical protein